MNKDRKIYKREDNNNLNMLPGDLKRSPDESFSKNNRPTKLGEILVFIDEAFLSKLSKYFGNGKYIKFDRYIFAKNLAYKENLVLKQIFLYTAPPFQSAIPTKEEETRKEGYDKLIEKLRKKEIIVREGRCQRLKSNNKFDYHQKAVDVLLAMDLTNVPLDFPAIKKIILISSDSDFVPVIQNLEKKGVKTTLYTYYEKKRYTPFSRSNHLIKSVHKYALLKKEDFVSALLKDRGEEART